MRVITGSDPNSFLSPIKYVFENIPNALINIAPERQQDFAREFDRFTLEYVDSDQWICHVDVPNRHIKLSRAVVELLWCESYAHIIVYTKHFVGKQITTPTEVALHADRETSEALQLLQWALHRHFGIQGASWRWPTELPRPTRFPPRDSSRNAASELCLCSIAFILHHELAHISLGHSGPSQLDRERDADHAAIDWIMNDLTDPHDARFTKRLLGIVQAMLLFTIRGIYTRKHGGISHPRDFDRLFYSITRCLADRTHPVFAFTVFVLKLHLDNARITLEEAVHSDFYSCFNSYIDALAGNQAVDQQQVIT